MCIPPFTTTLTPQPPRLHILPPPPLHPPTGFDGQDWYRELFDYGVPSDPDAPPPPADDADATLVPRLVEALVLPQALALARRCWDASDPRQSAALASVVADLLVYAPPDSEPMAELLAALPKALERAAGACAAPAWPGAAAAASPVAEAALHLRFRRGARLLRALAGFGELLGDEFVRRLALQQLLPRALLGPLRAAAAAATAPGDSAGTAGSALALAVARAEAVAGALPATWFHGDAPPPREAAPLLDLLQGLARALEAQRQAGGGDGGDSGSPDRAALARRLGAALAHVGMRRRGEALAAAFGARL